MLIKRDKFIKDFTRWVEMKLEKLPDENFEGEMLKDALEILVKHRNDLTEYFLK